MSLPPAFHESLPYIDAQLSDEVLAAAKALISAEAQASSPAPLADAKEPSFSPAMQIEFDRIASSTPLQPLDTKRYEAQELPPPAATTTRSAKSKSRSKSKTEPTADIETLKSVLSKAYTSSAYLESRLQNLKLLDKHGANAWLVSNYHLEAELKAVEKELAEVKRQIDEVNAARARRQGDVKGEMMGLEETWRRGVGKVLETEIAVEELKEQIRQELRNGAQKG